jgi:Ni,Fe-hydrogenase III small subunit/Pyruvate/2-oxoacid:ferredoxin oxidoreductase delta subunit
MFNIIRKTVQHKVVTVDYPAKPLKNKWITGKPVYDASACLHCMQCVQRCPTGAAVAVKEDGTIGFNLDQCIFCSLCADICPKGAIKMTNEFELAQEKREQLRKSPYTIEQSSVSGGDYELIGRQLKDKIGRMFGRSLQIREVDSGSCNGCDGEINSLSSPYNDIERFGIHFVASPRHADMLLVTGTAARNMELALIKTYNAMPDPKLVVAVGACACSGGIFRDSYSTRNGIDSIVPVDIYIPGCPPRPQALIYGILKAIEKA